MNVKDNTKRKDRVTVRFFSAKIPNKENPCRFLQKMPGFGVTFP